MTSLRESISGTSLRPDANLPHAATGWSRKTARRLLDNRVLPMMAPGRRVGSLPLRRINYKPGRECRVQYSVRLDTYPSDRSRKMVMTFLRRDQLAAVAAALGRGQGAAEGNGAPTRVFLADESCIVERYPSDWRLPDMAWAADADALSARMRDEGVTGWRATAARRLRYRPGQTCVFRYAFEQEDGTKVQAVGKVFSSEEQAGEVRAKLASLHEQAAGAPFGIPGLAFWPGAASLVLMQEAPGKVVDSLLRASEGEESARLVGLMAATLGSFHGMRWERGVVRTLERELGRLDRRRKRVRLVAPELGRAAHDVLGAVRLDELGDADTGTSLVHGDYKPNQLLLEGEHPYLIDIDRASPGDPAVDVGNFMAVLRKRAVIDGLDHLRALEEEFLADYETAQPGRVAERQARLAQGLALVRMALAKFGRSPRSYVRKGRDWPWWALLDEAAACLAQA